jgi:predicted nucleotidyltransferase component of viral defense system
VLYTNTVEQHTLELLKELMQLKFLKSFNLVGGTALSLLLGHRISVDLDLFTTTDFDRQKMQTALLNHFGNRVVITSSVKNKLGVFGSIDGVKVDLCFRPYPLLNDPLLIAGIRMWSLEDIAASKVFAISGRAVKKDFWDIDILLDKFTIQEITSFYQKRYQQTLAIAVAKMLTYFDEAEESENPKCLLGKTWPKIKQIK